MPNTLDDVIPQLLAQGLLALREAAFMPLLVNRQYESMAGQQGSTIDVPIPSSIQAQAVSPSNTPPSTGSVSPSSVPVPLDQWYEAAFYLTDKERLEVMDGFLPMQASEAIRSLANKINQYILDMYVKFYGFAGTPGTTPFGSNTQDATDARKVLQKQLAPGDPRHMVLSPDAEGNALNLRAFQDMSWSGTSDAIIAAEIERRLGFFWHSHQLMPSHTAGSGDGSYDGANRTVSSSHTAGVNTLTVASDGSAGNYQFKEGDIITIAGHEQTYVVGADKNIPGGGSADIAIEPELQVALSGSEAITTKGDHEVNLFFHRDAIAFATRPLERSDHPASIVEAMPDPESRLTLRLEVTREHKRDRFSYDILYGGAVVRPELGGRLAG